MSAEGMPPTLLDLFVPRPPLEFLKPARQRPQRPISCITGLVEKFETTEPPPIIPFEPPRDRRARMKRECQETHRLRLKELIREFDPQGDPNATRDPFATLFVSRISYETTEKKLKREFETFGPIRKLRLVTDRDGKPRGYAFIEFESERDMKEAYKHADGRKIDDRRVVVDVERGRTVSNWLPRRLGGGRGPARYTAPKRDKHGANTSLARSSYAGGSAPDYRREASSRPDRDAHRGSTRPRSRSRSRDRGRDGGSSRGGGGYDSRDSRRAPPRDDRYSSSYGGGAGSSRR